MLIWEYGLIEVLDSPVFGIGFADWRRPAFMVSPSVDSFWLLTAMRFGLPSIVSVLAILIYTSYRMYNGRFGILSDHVVGWATAMLGIFFVGVTVHFWASSFVLLAVMIGVGVSLSSFKASYIHNLKVERTMKTVEVV
ncbi:hypothetical protein GCM10022278_19580 [Allohahella marinimesophila]|uniref:Uncharacterized protein n=2 Tax=Allohahella marinimesophila TaxID=1054972 RepID=A0ABP7P8R8_9GAMM